MVPSSQVVPSSEAVPVFVRLAAHPVRWRLLGELAAGDHRVRELTERLGQPQNLVSYHLRLLRDGGLVTTRRSSFDARDSYYHLDLDQCAGALSTTASSLHPALRPSTPAVPSGARVLFACTGNSARSPMAEALLRHRTDGRLDVTSAGSHPKPELHPTAILVLRKEFGLDLAGMRPRHLDSVAGRRFDYVITLCDKVREVCPEFDDATVRSHWSIPDPATASGSDDYEAFARIAVEIDTRVRHLLPVLAANHSGGHRD
ncbi:helix-turn-helix domain-containing protein [Labedaea rhizosphaerae]|nr:helix-turn-helix domain-containing protein [Labedaea rhizosphaerae]